MSKFWIITCILTIIVIYSNAQVLYDVLGVNKSANKKEIRAAYKKLAMEWHPDKNSDPNATDRFMKINEAYETLIDPEKRQEYDRFGRTTSSGDQPRPTFKRGSPFSNFVFNFDFPGGGSVNDDLIEKFNVNYNFYINKVHPESHHKPYLLYVYADFCKKCMHVDRIFDRIVTDMENLGMGIGTVHANIARQLTDNLGIDQVPTIVAVVEGRVHFMLSKPTVHSIRDFVRSAVPSDFVLVNDVNYKEFLEGWSDNKVRILFCDSKSEPSLRYLLPAFAKKQRFSIGYVNIRKADSQQFMAKFHIQRGVETLLVFNEETEHPVAQVGMAVLSHSDVEQLMDAHKHLQLPRLSSQQLLDELCPAFTSVSRKSLCVVLLTVKGPNHDAHRAALRRYAQRHQAESVRVKYMYVWCDTQAHFVNKLTNGDPLVNSTSGALKMAVVWRKENALLHYDWLESGWFPEGPELDDAHAQLGALVSDWLSSKSAPPHIASLQFDLYNEHGYSLPYRMYLRLQDWCDLLWEKYNSLDDVTGVMILTSVMCLGLVYVMMRNVLRDEPVDPANNGAERPAGRARTKAHNLAPRDVTAPVSVSVNDTPRPVAVTVLPLVGHNFEEVVLRAEPGARVLVLFVDDASKMKLIQLFKTAVQPFARSKAFTFAFLQLEDHLSWFQRLLQQTVDDIGSILDLSRINARNCLGTVLALNGPRRSYSLYHAHTESMRRKRACAKRPDGSRVGQALGMDYSDTDYDESDTADEESQRYYGNGVEGYHGDMGGYHGEGGEMEERLFESDLLFPLQPWLERLCDGQVHKFRIGKWPRMDEN